MDKEYGATGMQEEEIKGGIPFSIRTSRLIRDKSSS